MSKYRVLVLMHQDLVPPVNPKKSEFNPDEVPWITEYDVITNLKEMGHEVLPLGVYSNLGVIRSAVYEFKPHIIFNLLEEFDGDALLDQNVVSYLELLKVPYTGCNPRGLILARDKALTKKILAYHRIKSPKFCVFPKNKKVNRPKSLNFPLIVKCLSEEASLGISKASVVHNDEKLKERVDYINKKLGVDAIAEQFIEGREFYVGIMGNYRMKSFPTWELRFDKTEKPEKEFYSRSAKWNNKYRKRKGINTKRAELDKGLEKKVIDTCKRTYKALSLNGYARIDLRITAENEIYIIEANPNPNIAVEDDFAASAKFANMPYQQLLRRILSLGLSWHSAD